MTIDDIKCLFLKHPRDTVMFKYDVLYPDLMKMGDSAYIAVNDSQVHFLGTLYALKADFLIYSGDTNRYAQYDVVVTRNCPDTFIKSKFRGDQMLCYSQSEPPGNSMATWGVSYDIKNPTITEPFDYFLNNNTLESINLRNIVSPLSHDMEFYKRMMVGHPKEPYKIFLQRRSQKGARAGGWPGVTFPLHYKLVNEWSDEWGIARNSYIDFMNSLSTCTYMISNDWTDSHGTIIGECSPLDVISFAPPHKVYTQLLLPQYCWFTTLEDVFRKIEELESNPTMKQDILTQIRTNIKKIDYHTFRDQMVSLYEKFVANGKKA